MISGNRAFYKIFFSKYGIVFFIFTLSFCLRLPFLSENSLWLDETYTIERSGISGKIVGLWETVTYIAHNDAHPPGYYLLIRAWSLVSSSELWLRLLSVLLDSLSVVFLYFLLSILTEHKKAILGSLLATTSCFLIHYSQEIRHYSLSNFLAVFSSWLIIKAISSRNDKFYILYIMSVLFGFYTYYYLAFLFLTQGVFLFFYAGEGQNLYKNIQNTGVSEKTLAKQIHFSYWVKSQLVATIFFFPWLYYVLPLKLTTFSQLNTNARGSLTINNIYTMFQEQLIGKNVPSYFSYIFIVLLLVLLVHILFFSKKKLLLICIPSILLPILITILFPFKGHIFQSKHLIYLLPCIIATISISSQNIRSLIFLVFMFVIINFYSLYFEYSQEEQPWKTAISELHEQVKYGDVLCFNPYYLEVPVTYYYNKHIKRKKIVPAFVYLFPQKNIPIKLRPFIYFDKKHLNRIRKRNVWVIEIVNCHSAPREFRLQKWFQEKFQRHSQKIYQGDFGNIIITKYHPK